MTAAMEIAKLELEKAVLPISVKRTGEPESS